VKNGVDFEKLRMAATTTVSNILDAVVMTSR
jgi:hypothetical protein